MVRICSACLLGVCCRFDGKSKPHSGVMGLLEREILIPVCPEQLGGLPIPHPPSIREGERVINAKGEDVTAFFEKGAKEVLKIARLYKVKGAIMKQRSPSCGCGEIYADFSGRIIAGDGVTTELLKKNAIEVISEEGIGA